MLIRRQKVIQVSLKLLKSHERICNNFFVPI